MVPRRAYRYPVLWCGAINDVHIPRSAVVAIGVVAVISAALLTIAGLWADGDFLGVVLPSYLTGIGTLALATLTYLLMRQEGDDRRALQDAEGRTRREAALAEARKVITLVRTRRYDGTGRFLRNYDVIEVLNAGDEPILDVRLIRAEARSSPDDPVVIQWMHGSGGGYIPVVLAGNDQAFNGNWQRTSAAGELENVPTLSSAENGNSEVVIAWTDSRGNHWIRFGRDLPQTTPTAWTWEQQIPLRTAHTS